MACHRSTTLQDMSGNYALAPSTEFVSQWGRCDGEVDEDNFQLRRGAQRRGHSIERPRGAQRRGRSIERPLKPQPFLHVPVKKGDMVHVAANRAVLERLLSNNGYEYNPLNDLMLGGTFQVIEVTDDGSWVFLPSPQMAHCDGCLAFPRQAVKKLPQTEISPLVVSKFVATCPSLEHFPLDSRGIPNGLMLWTIPMSGLWGLDKEEKEIYAVRDVNNSSGYVNIPWGQYVFGIIMDNGDSLQLFNMCDDGRFTAANVFLPTRLFDEFVLMEVPA